jgi:hypothetical protein
VNTSPNIGIEQALAPDESAGPNSFLGSMGPEDAVILPGRALCPSAAEDDATKFIARIPLPVPDPQSGHHSWSDALLVSHWFRQPSSSVTPPGIFHNQNAKNRCLEFKAAGRIRNFKLRNWNDVNQ